jgi:hypothetical protein
MTISTPSNPPPVFATLPAAAEAVLGRPDGDALARHLTVLGIQPDGLVSYGGRLMPIFSPVRIAEIRAALGGRAVASV